MRILKILFSWLVIALLIGAIAFLAGREALLLMAVSQIDQSISELRGISRNPAQYVTICREMGVPTSIAAISQLRLRFVSPNEYYTEVLCTQFNLDPILVRRSTLPFMVTKLPGSTGIIFGDQPSGVMLSSYGRTRGVGIKGRITASFEPRENLGVWPTSACSGYGFMCCDDVQQSGQGDQYVDALDCPKSCYSFCQARPVVLSLVTDPIVDSVSRTVTIRNGESVAFTYQVSLPGKAPFTGTFDFGDGNKQTLTDTTNLVTHQYQCASQICKYVATVSFTYNGSVSSAPTSISTIAVDVVQ